jgi:hypothetical protein
MKVCATGPHESSPRPSRTRGDDLNYPTLTLAGPAWGRGSPDYGHHPPHLPGWLASRLTEGWKEKTGLRTQITSWVVPNSPGAVADLSGI